MKPRQLFQKSMLLACLLLTISLCFSQVTEQWVKRYNGPANGNDIATAVAVDAAGNVYVTGYRNSGDFNYDYATIKYDATGAELWIRKYNGPENYGDVASALAVDAAGNVYVTGSSDGEGRNPDYATIKYDAAGNELWVKRYTSGFANGEAGDAATALAIDVLGNVYVTGGSYTSNSDVDYTTIKYDAAGNEVWIKRYNGTGNNIDIPNDLAVDAAGNVYVTGYTFISDFNYDYATVKYDAAGNELWIKKYDGPGNSRDIGFDLAVDATGNVYVTGYSEGSGTFEDYATVKYDAAGTELWIKRYNGPENFLDEAVALAIDTDGNVYVTGSSSNTDFSSVYTTIKYDAAGNELWIRIYNGGRAGSLAVDAKGNVYVTGASPGSETNDDYATIKYDVNGNQLWVKRYNGPANSIDDVTSLAIDAAGNVYVTGYSYTTDNNTDYATIKYAQNQAGAVSTFTLINADTDEAIRELKDGDLLNVAALPTLNLNIRANTNPAIAGSVVFSLSGAASRNHTENIVPYALFADNNNGDYYGWTPKNGNYTLTATPYSATKGKGEKGTSLTIHFTVTGTAISSLILVNAETDQDIKTLQNGDVIDLSTLLTDKLNIRAVVHPNTVGSVVFNLNNRYIVRENLVPYAIGGDIKGDYRAWTLPTGHHNLTATPYDGKYGRGKKGKAYRVAFTVVDMAAITRAANLEKPFTDAYDVGHSLSATPNPFAGQTLISFSVPTSGYTTVQVCDMKGIEVARLYQAWADAEKVYQVSFAGRQLPGGVYVLSVASENHVRSSKLMLIR